VTKQKDSFINDILAAIKAWRIWLLLGWQDIQLRYRRSVIGPFWFTISMAVIIVSIGFVYGHLFRAKLDVYLPFLATGIITWGMISTMLNESTNAFIESETYIKQIKIPFLCFLLRVCLRNIIIFFHNILAFIPVVIFYHIPVNWYLLCLIPAFAIITLNCVFFGAVLAVIGARYRDFGQVITNLLQVAFYLTPIMWYPALMPERFRYLIDINPFAQFIDIIRYPLLGQPTSMHTWVFVLCFTFVGFLLCWYVFPKNRAKIVFNL